MSDSTQTLSNLAPEFVIEACEHFNQRDAIESRGSFKWIASRCTDGFDCCRQCVVSAINLPVAAHSTQCLCQL